jgi:hypothetical protein
VSDFKQIRAASQLKPETWFGPLSGGSTRPL